MKSMEKPRKRKTSATESKSPKNQHSDKKLKWTDYSVAEFKVEVKDPTTTFQGECWVYFHYRSLCQVQNCLEKHFACEIRTFSDA